MSSNQTNQTNAGPTNGPLGSTAYSSPPTVQKYSAFFLLDFISRYAVDRCGADDTVFTAFMSFVCVLPFWVWLCSVIMMLTRVELYWAMAKYTITLLTLVTVLFLFLFETTPPVLGCGPDQSFPSPQSALSAYALCTYIYYAQMVPNGYSKVVHGLLVATQAVVAVGLLYIGMASPSSVLAGTLVGAVVACLLHETLLNLSERQGLLTKFILFLENKLGIHTVDSLLQGVHKMGKFGKTVVLETIPVEEDYHDDQYNDRHGVGPNRPLATEFKPLLELTNPNREVLALHSLKMGYKE